MPSESVWLTFNTGSKDLIMPIVSTPMHLSTVKMTPLSDNPKSPSDYIHSFKKELFGVFEEHLLSTCNLSFQTDGTITSSGNGFLTLDFSASYISPVFPETTYNFRLEFNKSEAFYHSPIIEHCMYFKPNTPTTLYSSDETINIFTNEFNAKNLSLSQGALRIEYSARLNNSTDSTRRFISLSWQKERKTNETQS